jgi:uncharacterized membrane protein YcaP (DUF421 family)
MFDASDVFGFTMSPAEIALRGTLIYWFLYLVFRFVLRRDVGSMGITDFLFVVLLGDAAQNGMIGNGTSTSDAVVLLATLVLWNFLIDWATARYPALERIMLPRRIVLVSNGVCNRRNLRREFISNEELMSKVRAHGLDTLRDVKAAYLESDGEVTVIPRKPGQDSAADDGASKHH